MNDALGIGSKIYYTGDMANVSGHFEVVGQHFHAFTLKELPGGLDRTFPGVLIGQIGYTYRGTCSPRFVTEEARQAFRALTRRQP